MSIVNNAHPGSHLDVLILMDDFFNHLNQQRQRSIKVDEVLQQLRPDGLATLASDNAKKKLAENLNFWLEQGLWPSQQQDGQQLIQIAEVIWSEPFVQRLNRVIIEIALQRNSTEIIEYHNVEPLIYGLARLLHRDQYTILGGDYIDHTGTDKNSGQVFNQGLTQKRAFNESNELSYMLYWLRFLGFLEVVSHRAKDDRYVIDITRAIRPYLQSSLTSTPQPIGEWITQFAKTFPFVRGAELMEWVGADLRAEGWQAEDPSYLDAVLAQSLLRLEAEGCLKLIQRSDDDQAKKIRLSDHIRSISMIAWKADSK